MRRWGAVYLLFGMFLGSLAGQGVAQYWEAHSQAEEHGQPFQWPDYWARFASATLENWQSEFLQLVFQSVLLLGPIGYLMWQADQNADKEDVQALRADIESLQRAIRSLR